MKSFVAIFLLFSSFFLALCQAQCGCARSNGYWKSNRFISPDDEVSRCNGEVCLGFGQSVQSLFGKGYSQNSKDTCKWPNASIGPALLPCDGKNCEIMGCFNSTFLPAFCNYSWYQIINTPNSPEGINDDYWKFLTEYITIRLNFANGYCDCNTGFNCSRVKNVFTNAFVKLNPTNCAIINFNYVCNTSACISACNQLVALNILPNTTDCNQANIINILSGYNHGYGGPASCVDGINSGCCEKCVYSSTKFVESCPPPVPQCCLSIYNHTSTAVPDCTSANFLNSISHNYGDCFDLQFVPGSAICTANGFTYYTSSGCTGGINPFSYNQCVRTLGTDGFGNIISNGSCTNQLSIASGFTPVNSGHWSHNLPLWAQWTIFALIVAFFIAFLFALIYWCWTGNSIMGIWSQYPRRIGKRLA